MCKKFEGLSTHRVPASVVAADKLVKLASSCRWDFSGGASDWNASDCDGHGTHVASVAAGRTVGVAKEANVVAVKVLDCDGSGTISTVTAGECFSATHFKYYCRSH